MDPCVDLVVNCFERTYRQVLRPGFLGHIAEQNRFPFARRQVLINNVEDGSDAMRRARALLDAGEVDEVFRVEDHLASALAVTGLTHRQLGRLPHYSDCALVAVTRPGSPWIAYWDAEAALTTPNDWIGPSIELMERDRRVLIANPCWLPSTVANETWEETPPFALGFGFSDQVFLARRQDLAAPIYGEWCLASLRYPLSHIAQVFEARVDAYMRRHRRFRATHVGVTYTHEQRSTVHNARDDLSQRERFRRWRNRKLTALLRRSPFRHPCWRI